MYQELCQHELLKLRNILQSSRWIDEDPLASDNCISVALDFRSKLVLRWELNNVIILCNLGSSSFTVRCFIVHSSHKSNVTYGTNVKYCTNKCCN